jgi:hypothetical protein
MIDFWHPWITQALAIGIAIIFVMVFYLAWRNGMEVDD